jgi:hypothetical protein
MVARQDRPFERAFNRGFVIERCNRARRPLTDCARNRRT